MPLKLFNNSKLLPLPKINRGRCVRVLHNKKLQIFKNTRHEIITKYKYPSASTAYNKGIEEANNDIIIFFGREKDITLTKSQLKEISKLSS